MNRQKVIAFVIVFALAVSSLPVFVFATSSSFVSVPFVNTGTISNGSLSSSGSLIGHRSNFDVYVGRNVSDKDEYCFFVSSESKIYVVSSTDGQNYSEFGSVFCSSSGNSSSIGTNITGWYRVSPSSDNSVSYWVVPFSFSGTLDSSVSSYSSLIDGVDAFHSWLTSDPDPDPDPDPVPDIPGFGNTFTFSLPAGYAAMIYERGVNTSITLNTIFREKSALVPSSVGSNGQWWWGNSQSWCFADWVAVGDVFYTGDSFDSSLINWVRKNQMFGTRQSINGSYTLSWDSSEHEGVVIVNPYFNYYDSMYNNDISITVSAPLSIWVYKLDSFFDNSGSAPLVKSSVTARYILGGDGQYYAMDSNGDPIPNTNTTVLPVGGDNASSDNQTAVLDNIVSGISQFFSGTWNHIRTLTEAIGGFPSMLRDMYSAFPSDIVGVIVALFGILAAVGVIKALL